MEVSSLQIGLDALIALLVSLAGGLGVWHTLKGRVAIQQITLDSLTKDIDEIKQNKKESNLLLHKRIDDLKNQVSRNREISNESLAELKTEMQAMELRIIKAINGKGSMG